jgi:predicted short-subunit dehydrogenase-like oxidoreductase (DUF2520 family)
MAHSRVIIVGCGRAGGSFAIAARRAGYDVRLVAGPSGRVIAGFEDSVVRTDAPLPRAHLVVLAVRDDAIRRVASDLVPRVSGSPVVAHLSGLTSVGSLAPLRDSGLQVGSLHPLMTLPDPERGADALEASWAAVTADDDVAEVLFDFATALGMTPFRLPDEAKPLYHAAASAAGNFVTAVLGLAEELARSAAVPFEAFRPLAETAVAAAVEAGANATLTGPVARGDWATVVSQLRAVDALGGDLGEDYRALVEVTARLAGRLQEARAVVESN